MRLFQIVPRATALVMFTSRFRSTRIHWFFWMSAAVWSRTFPSTTAWRSFPLVSSARRDCSPPGDKGIVETPHPWCSCADVFSGRGFSFPGSGKPEALISRMASGPHRLHRLGRMLLVDGIRSSWLKIGQVFRPPASRKPAWKRQGSCRFVRAVECLVLYS